MILPGDPAPLFLQKANTDWGHYSFDMAAGRYSLLIFMPSAHSAPLAFGTEAFRDLEAKRRNGILEIFCIAGDCQGGTNFCSDLPTDDSIIIFDKDHAVHKLYNVASDQMLWVLVDPMLRIKQVLPDSPDVAENLNLWLDHAPRFQNGPIPALMLDDVLEPQFCQALISYYQSQPQNFSGILTRNSEGAAIQTVSQSFKRRHDCVLRDEALVRGLQARIIRRVVPEIRKSFQCTVTGMDRMIVGCYDAAELGGFGPHRDNTVKGAFHRLFAISLNLNNDFKGGELVFPEFSDQGFCPPAGGALIFSSALMHAVRPVTEGKRYACLPFAFNEESLAYARSQEDMMEHKVSEQK
ncbi:MAG: 2OG-Fe(II) oxygenase [Acetobacter sp.]|uniref:2OG-Fe(II) oxygenase n=1 Tax=Acetobacter sp. TaxID=440 RepID=UPI0039E7F876